MRLSEHFALDTCASACSVYKATFTKYKIVVQFHEGYMLKIIMEHALSKGVMGLLYEVLLTGTLISIQVVAQIRVAFCALGSGASFHFTRAGFASGRAL